MRKPFSTGAGSGILIGGGWYVYWGGCCGWDKYDAEGYPGYCAGLIGIACARTLGLHDYSQLV